MEVLTEYWLLILLGLAAAIAIAWYVFHATRRTGIAGERSDVLDEGATRAARNQALIDTPAAAPAPAPPPAPSATPKGAADDTAGDLARIKGIGPKIIAELAALGVTRVDQVAGWSEAEAARIDDQLGRFQGRMARDEWIAQAKLLNDGDDAGYAKRFGNTG